MQRSKRGRAGIRPAIPAPAMYVVVLAFFATASLAEPLPLLGGSIDTAENHYSGTSEEQVFPEFSTKAERLLRLDQDFYNSIGQFDRCRKAALVGEIIDDCWILQGAAAAASGQDGGGSSGVDGTPVESEATLGITGTEQGEVVNAGPAQGRASGTTAPEPGAAKIPPASLQNVLPSADVPVIPKDIPPSSNDDILATQIRNAAIAETDPDTKEKLWNEYRRYKSLPVAGQ